MLKQSKQSTCFAYDIFHSLKFNKFGTKSKIIIAKEKENLPVGICPENSLPSISF